MLASWHDDEPFDAKAKGRRPFLDARNMIKIARPSSFSRLSLLQASAVIDDAADDEQRQQRHRACLERRC